MQELNDIVNDALSKMQENGKIEEIIAKKVEETVESAINDQLREHSNFGRNIKEQLKAILQVDLSGAGIPSYHDFIIKSIRKSVDDQLKNSSVEKLENMISSIIANPPATIKLSDFIEDFRENSEEDACDDGEEYFTFIVDDDHDGFVRIHFDTKSDKEKWNCKNKLHCKFDKENKGPEGEDLWEVFSVTIDGEDTNRSMFAGPFYNFERTMYQMHCCNTKLIIDVSPDCDDQMAYHWPDQ